MISQMRTANVCPAANAYGTDTGGNKMREHVGVSPSYLTKLHPCYYGGFFWCGRSHPKAQAFRNFNAFRMPHRHHVVLLLITWYAWKFTNGAEDRRGSTDFAPKQAALTGDWSSVLSPDTFNPAKWVISKTRPTPMVTSTDSVFPVSRQSAPLMNLEIPL